MPPRRARELSCGSAVRVGGEPGGRDVGGSVGGERVDLDGVGMCGGWGRWKGLGVTHPLCHDSPHGLLVGDWGMAYCRWAMARRLLVPVLRAGLVPLPGDQ